MTTLPPSSRPVFLAVVTTAALLVAQQVASKATRDALFLASWGPELLPWAMLGSALCSFAASFGMTFLMARWGPRRTIVWLLGSSALLYGLEWRLAEALVQWVAWVLYFHVALFGMAILSGFWTIYGELFDPHTAKSRMGQVGAGATFGGVIGALLVERLASWSTTRSSLLLLVALHLACALVLSFGLRSIGKSGQAKPRDEPRQSGRWGKRSTGITRVAKDKYLRLIGLFVLVTTASETLLDFALKQGASLAIPDEQGLVRFFALFYSGVAALGFLTQSLVVDRALRHLGIAGTLALLPGLLAPLALPIALVGRLPGLIGLKGLSAVLGVSTHRSSYELLYTPLPPEEKRSSKAWIDLALDRLGSASGSGLVLLALVIVPSWAGQLSTLTAGLLGLAGLWLCFLLHRGYVAELASSLESGQLDPNSISAIDVTTQRTIAETTLGLDRQRLLREIEQLRLSQGLPSGQEPAPPSSRGAPPGDRSVEADELSRQVRVLAGGAPGEITSLLQSGAVSDRLTGVVIPLLEHPQLQGPVKTFLLTQTPRISGQLGDGLFDSQLTERARRRIPGILREVADPLAVAALVLALELDSFELRFRSGQALVHLSEAHPDLVRLSRQQIDDLVLRELRTPAARATLSEPKGRGETQSPLDSEAAGWLTDELRRRLRHRLEHVFSLLSLVRDRAPLRACLRALYGRDEYLRGTALEYLENVLPDSVREELWPLLEVPTGRARRPVRGTAEVLEDLLRSGEALPSGSPSAK